MKKIIASIGVVVGVVGAGLLIYFGIKKNKEDWI